MPLTAAETKTQLEETVGLNPKTTAKRQVIQVSLIFDDIEFVPVALYEALDAKYGTVSSEKDTISHRDFIFRIST